jgi:glycosyltransferase involved in cell wall biosynthesis
LRIAQVTDFYLPRLGGVEMHVHDLAMRQRAAGHAVEVLTATPGADLADLPVRRLTDGCRRPAALHPAAARQVGQVLRSGAYDQVHVHAGVLSPLAFAAVAAAVRNGIPVVVTQHSLLSAYEPAFRAWAAAGGWASWPVQWSAVSQVAARPIRRLVGPHRPVLVLPNGIDPAQWRVRPAPRDPADVLIVAVMRLAARKRPLPLLRILRRTRQRLSAGIRLRAIIVGDGRQRPAVERRLGRDSLGEWVELPGRLPREQIHRQFERADLFVAPAVLESFGIAALEARCAGLPVLARAGCGIGTFVEHGRTGILAADDDRMVDALVRLAADPAERERMARQSRQDPPDLGWTSVLRRTEEAYTASAALLSSTGPAVLGATA